MYLTSTAKFRPYTFDEMIKPDVIYTEAYNQMEDALSDLGIMAGDVGGKLDATNDKELVNIYNSFQSDLNKVSTDLYNNGLNPSIRKKLAELKGRYSKEINPINDAYKAWTADREYLAKLALEHPEIIIEGRGNKISDYMHGNKPAGISINTNDLFTKASKLATQDAVRTYKEGQWQSTAGGRFLERATSIGLTEQEFNNALEEINDYQNGLIIESALSADAKAILNSTNAITSSHNFNQLSGANKLKALNAIESGLRAGYTYKKDIQTQQDPMFKHNLDLARDAAKKKQQIADMVGTELFVTPNETRQEIGTTFFKSKGPEITNELQDKYNQFFDENGKLKAPEDIKSSEISISASSSISLPPYNIRNNTVNSLPRTAINRISSSLRQSFIDLGLDPNTATKDDFIKAYKNLDTSDATGMVVGTITSDKAGFDVIRNQIQRGMLGNKDLRVVAGKNEDNSYRTKPIKYEDLLADKDKNELDIVSVDVNYTNGQTTFKVNTPKGVKQIVMPKGAHFNWTNDDRLKSISKVISSLSNNTYSSIIDGNIVERKVDPKNTYEWPGGFKGTPAQYQQYLKGEMDALLVQMFNYYGKQNIGS
jgi:hypothetical protein